ncbi:MAG: prolyl aminopeptidase [Rhodospirillaceae bacterium]|nr:prolyl aminopeptidase [Rhodospirillaceae bacterium]
MDRAQAKDLYPDTEPTRTGRLAVDDDHTLYWEEMGSPDGMPVVFLHGGPGSGSSPMHRRFFDPEAYRIVVFDQRGAGRSTPVAEVKNNTTQDLVADIECLREHLGIKQWLIFGGSWGSTLALAYGQTHPDRCLGFVLRGIFLGESSEIDWFLHGMGQIFPESHRRLVEFLPEAERDDLLGSYHRRLTDPDPAIHRPAAERWAGYENDCSQLLPGPDYGNPASGEHALSVARLEVHYFVNQVFFGAGQLLAGVETLRGKPAIIVQGRYDIICPIRTADKLARAWPEAEYVIVPDAGHSATEPGIRMALVRATDAMRTRLSGRWQT